MNRFLYVPAAMTVLLAALPSSGATDKKEFPEPCPVSNEYVGTLNFLRSHKEGLASEKDAPKIALKVVEGCKGSTKRFIKVVSLLTKAGMIPPQAIEKGIEFSARTDDETETFVFVFQRAFLSEYLDLDLRNALKMAENLTTEFEGNSKNVRKDFEKILMYCAGRKTLDLPLPKCGELAGRIARHGQKYDGGVSKGFIELFEYLTSKSGPRIATGDALKLAEQIVAIGKGAADNYIVAYRFAISKSGFQMEAASAMAFAREMARKTYPEATPDAPQPHKKR